jgi:hypothetical protein
MEVKEEADVHLTGAKKSECSKDSPVLIDALHE